ncbi:MAG: nucleoside-diphosphate-sugar [Geobacteraceae bacterium]|nr:MAG: nucleoside-diphosphate-sugar [Geobacteraceae bacterium]
MKVLITGATGFIGACLTRRLVAEGHDVHIVTRKESERWRIQDILSHLTEHTADLRDAAAVDRCVESVRPSVIYHLATFGGFAFQRDALAILASNLLGTAHLLRACEKVGFDLFVNTGSSSEYGVKSLPMKETDLLEPLGEYGVSKSAATLFCRSEALTKNLPVVSLRLFSPYGPWDDPHRLIPQVITRLLRGEAPRLSSPQSVRDYIFIDDVVALYLALPNRPVVPGDIFNVGSGRQATIGEVVTVISEIIGGSVKPVWGAVERVRPEPAMWVADIGKVQAKLEWKPTYSMRDGLEKTIGWFRNNLGHYP